MITQSVLYWNNSVRSKLKLHTLYILTIGTSKKRKGNIEACGFKKIETLPMYTV